MALRRHCGQGHEGLRPAAPTNKFLIYFVIRVNVPCMADAATAAFEVFDLHQLYQPPRAINRH